MHLFKISDTHTMMQALADYGETIHAVSYKQNQKEVQERTQSTSYVPSDRRSNSQPHCISVAETLGVCGRLSRRSKIEADLLNNVQLKKHMTFYSPQRRQAMVLNHEPNNQRFGGNHGQLPFIASSSDDNAGHIIIKG